MKIPLFKIYWSKNDIQSVEKIIKSGKYWATGKQIEKLEKEICKFLKIKYCLVFNSGGSALFTLMKAFNFKKGDEIIVPSFTFIATAYAPLYVGAKPIFADIEEKTLGLDPEDVRKKITPKTKAIIAIHYGGMPCQINKLKKIAKEYKINLIEDVAESFGARIKNKYVGTFGKAGILSFCQNKIFTTGEGGAIITNSREIYKKAKLIRSYGQKSIKSNVDYITPGYNLRMPTMLAALGLSQLKKVNWIIKKRREKAKYLNENLKKNKEIIVFEQPNQNYYPVYQLYTIRVLKNKRNKLLKYLQKKGISCKIYFKPAHKYTAFKKLGYKHIRLPNTEKISKQVLSLPIYPEISLKELKYITTTIKSFFKND